MMGYVQQFPLPPLRRAMVFIDGENLVLRYEEMKASGRIPTDGVHQVSSVFVWHPGTWMPPNHAVLRATYYTYVQGDEVKVEDTSEALRSLTFQQYRPLTQPHLVAGITNLYPKVYKKGKGKKAKGVDIQMTVDILSNVYQDNIDSVYILSGDGDYKPVIEECIRRGKQVYISAFSSGLHDGLKLMADQFVCLDDFYFRPPQAGE